MWNKSFSIDSIMKDKASLIVAIIINLLVLVNSIIHHPLIGYDTTEHLRYAQVLLRGLPTPEQTHEFFSPPLPYFVPAIVYDVCFIAGDDLSCRLLAGKIGQFINFAFSIAITIIFIKICDLLNPNNKTLKLSTLLMLAITTVYYKTFSQFRGEPYVAFFAMWTIYALLIQIKKGPQYTFKDAGTLGILLGLLILSRQWGIFLFSGLGFLGILAFKNIKTLMPVIYKMAVTTLVAFVVGGWFYIHLYNQHGTFTAFNLEPAGFSLGNQPLSFYRNTGLGDFLIFKSPTRPTFDNQLMPIFYSETWGDYWGYFIFIKENSYFGELGHGNFDEVNAYLGRVNLASLFPSLIFIFAFIAGLANIKKAWQQNTLPIDVIFSAMLAVILFFTLIGFFWFVVSYPLLPKGVTIKPSYLIQIYVILPILSGLFLEKIRTYNKKLYWLILMILAFVFVHNLPAMISRYAIFLV